MSSRSKPTLLFIRDIFGTLRSAQDKGMHSRNLKELEAYSRAFGKIYVRTYESERFLDLPPNVEHIPYRRLPLQRFFYFFSPGIWKPRRVDSVELSGITAIVPALIHKKRGSRLFLWFSWNLETYLRANRRPALALVARLIETVAFRACDAIAVTTERLGQDVLKHTSASKIYLVPNFLDTDLFKPLDVSKVPHLLIFVGRLHPGKNLELLLQAMKRLPQYSLWSIGSGPLRSELEATIEKEGMHNVKLLGSVPNEKLPSLLNQAEAFVMLSHSEGQPLALAEAMACGLPCIGTDVTGIRDMVSHGENGILCENTVEGAVNAVTSLFQDRLQVKEIGHNARDYAVRHFSAEVILERKVKLLLGDTAGLTPLFPREEH